MEKTRLDATELFKTCKQYSHAKVGENRVNDAKFRAKLMADRLIIEYDNIKSDEVSIDFIIERMEHWENVKKEIDLF